MSTTALTQRAVALALALAATPAHAHLVDTGFGAFYDGIAHVMLTPADLLAVVALALLAAQRETRAARWTLLVLPAAWLAGGAAGAAFATTAMSPVPTTLTFALAGAIVALDLRLPAGVVALLAVAAGVLHGFANGATMAPHADAALMLAGVVTSIFCLFAIIAAEVSVVRAAWARIATRVVGSWLLAAGILMLGWIARSSA